MQHSACKFFYSTAQLFIQVFITGLLIFLMVPMDFFNNLTRNPISFIMFFQQRVGWASAHQFSLFFYGEMKGRNGGEIAGYYKQHRREIPQKLLFRFVRLLCDFQL
jgi:hypothetical protein